VKEPEDRCHESNLGIPAIVTDEQQPVEASALISTPQ
jgi:hypothetical protein